MTDGTIVIFFLESCVSNSIEIRILDENGNREDAPFYFIVKFWFMQFSQSREYGTFVHHWILRKNLSQCSMFIRARQLDCPKEVEKFFASKKKSFFNGINVLIEYKTN